MPHRNNPTEAELARRRAKYQPVADLLKKACGEPQWRLRLPPVDELISTILSQNTNDGNRDQAFARLRERFPTWEAVRDAPVERLIDAIRPAGLANLKGPRIQAALRYLTETQGRITLDHLKDMPLDRARAWLETIHGVGPKTAAIVLLFAFGRPAFPVDTHVHRVSQRLGLIGPKVSAAGAHAEMEEIVPPEDFYTFHLNMIRHGRTLCHARRPPECDRCPLTAYCDYYQARL
jgi:endonuclease-3